MIDLSWGDYASLAVIIAFLLVQLVQWRYNKARQERTDAFWTKYVENLSMDVNAANERTEEHDKFVSEYYQYHAADVNDARVDAAQARANFPHTDIVVLKFNNFGYGIVLRQVAEGVTAADSTSKIIEEPK